MTPTEEPFFRRVGADGPLVPDGGGQCLHVTASGWALLRSQASNLYVTPTYGVRFFLRSPTGVLESVAALGRGDFSFRGAVSEDGATVVLNGPGGAHLYQRQAGGFQHRSIGSVPALESWVALREGGVAFPVLNGLSLDYDLKRDALTRLPRARFETLYPERPLGVSTNGRWSIWNASGGFLCIDLTNGQTYEWKTGSPSSYPGNGGVASEGQTIWIFIPATETTTARFVRHDFSKETTEAFPAPGVADATPTAVAGPKVFFYSSTPIVGDDKNSSPDLYAFDHVSGEIELISRGNGSGLASGGVTSAKVSPKGDRVYFTSAEAGMEDRFVPHPEGDLYVRDLPGG
ncbi:hypothetical protein EON79_23620, partial [bacterium]